MRSTERFSSRVADYVRYRPSYPARVVTWLEEQADLDRHAHVVDLGSGTGLLSKVFIDAGYSVTGVEPNRPMREAGIEFLRAGGGYRAIDGSAEATGLEPGCCDLVISGQAFHWFDPVSTRIECLRILRRPALAAMIWNERCLGTAFMDDYESVLLTHAPEYRKITASHVDRESLDTFFGLSSYRRFELPNHQLLDLAALRGRVMSSSYAPLPGRHGHEEMMYGLSRVFAIHAVDGKVEFIYRTVVMFGDLDPVRAI
jgi:SAM-dependent methyltransferase